MSDPVGAQTVGSTFAALRQHGDSLLMSAGECMLDVWFQESAYA